MVDQAVSAGEEWEGERIKFEGRCEECKSKRVVSFIVDPFHRNYYNESIERNLCKACFEYLSKLV